MRVLVVVAVSLMACGEVASADDAGTGGGGGSGGGTATGGAGGGDVTRPCEVACDATQVCESGGCASRAIAVRWLAPGDAARVDAGSTMLVAVIVPFPGRPQSPPSELVATLLAPDAGLSTVRLVGGDGGYSAQVDVTNGLWSATTSYGVLTAQQAFRVGPVPLQLRVDLGAVADAGASNSTVRFEDPQFPGSHRRDAHVPVRVRASAGEVDPASFSAQLLSGTQRTQLTRATCPLELSCADESCVCFDADLSVPRFDQFRGEFELEVSARDREGSGVTVGSAQGVPRVRVTRWAWGRRFFTTNATDVALGPFFAVDSAGRVIAAYTQGSSATTVSIDAAGSLAWQSSRWTQTTPIVSTWPDAGEVAHLPNFGEAFVTVSTATGAVINRATTTSFFGISEPVTLAPERTDGGEALLLGLAYPGDPASHALFTYGSTGWSTQNGGSGTQWGLVGDGSRLIWSTSDLANNPHLFSRRFDDAWSLEQSLAVPTPAWHLVPTDAGVIGSAAFPQGSSWFRWPVGASALDWQTQPATSTPSRAFVMPNANELIGPRFTSTSASELVRLQVGQPAPSVRTSLPAASQGAPALGADGAVYVLTVEGHLLALRAGTLTPVWQERFSSESFENAPLLDCGREASGELAAGRPGRLLLVGRSGRAYAIVVDARGADPNAHWPLAFHDAHNTNNLQTPLSRFVCP